MIYDFSAKYNRDTFLKFLNLITSIITDATYLACGTMSYRGALGGALILYINYIRLYTYCNIETQTTSTYLVKL